MRRERERLAVDTVTDSGWTPANQVEAESWIRRKSIQLEVAAEHPGWDGRRVAAESGRRWKAEGWEERICQPETNLDDDFPEIAQEAP